MVDLHNFCIVPIGFFRSRKSNDNNDKYSKNHSYHGNTKSSTAKNITTAAVVAPESAINKKNNDDDNNKRNNFINLRRSSSVDKRVPLPPPGKKITDNKKTTTKKENNNKKGVVTIKDPETELFNMCRRSKNDDNTIVDATDNDNDYQLICYKIEQILQYNRSIIHSYDIETGYTPLQMICNNHTLASNIYLIKMLIHISNSLECEIGSEQEEWIQFFNNNNNNNGGLPILNHFLNIEPTPAKAVRQRSVGGLMALHVSCSNACNITIDVIEYIINCHPAAVTVPDILYGNLPLHEACLSCSTKQYKNFVRLELILLLIQKWPESCKIINRDGNLPLHLAVHVTNPKTIRNINNNNNNNNNNSSDDDNDNNNRKERNNKKSLGTPPRSSLHNKKSTLLRSNSHSSDDDNNTIDSNYIEKYYNSQLYIIQYLIFCYPDGLYITNKDGYTPIQIAILTSMTNNVSIENPITTFLQDYMKNNNNKTNNDNNNKEVVKSSSSPMNQQKKKQQQQKDFQAQMSSSKRALLNYKNDNDDDDDSRRIEHSNQLNEDYEHDYDDEETLYTTDGQVDYESQNDAYNDDDDDNDEESVLLQLSNERDHKNRGAKQSFHDSVPFFQIRELPSSNDVLILPPLSPATSMKSNGNSKGSNNSKRSHNNKYRVRELPSSNDVLILPPLSPQSSTGSRGSRKNINKLSTKFLSPNRNNHREVPAAISPRQQQQQQQQQNHFRLDEKDYYSPHYNRDRNNKEVENFDDGIVIMDHQSYSDEDNIGQQQRHLDDQIDYYDDRNLFQYLDKNTNNDGIESVKDELYQNNYYVHRVADDDMSYKVADDDMSYQSTASRRNVFNKKAVDRQNNYYAQSVADDDMSYQSTVSRRSVVHKKAVEQHDEHENDDDNLSVMKNDFSIEQINNYTDLLVFSYKDIIRDDIDLETEFVRLLQSLEERINVAFEAIYYMKQAAEAEKELENNQEIEVQSSNLLQQQQEKVTTDNIVSMLKNTKFDLTSDDTIIKTSSLSTTSSQRRRSSTATTRNVAATAATTAATSATSNSSQTTVQRLNNNNSKNSTSSEVRNNTIRNSTITIGTVNKNLRQEEEEEEEEENLDSNVEVVIYVGKQSGNQFATHDDDVSTYVMDESDALLMDHDDDLDNISVLTEAVLDHNEMVHAVDEENYINAINQDWKKRNEESFDHLYHNDNIPRNIATTTPTQLKKKQAVVSSNSISSTILSSNRQVNNSRSVSSNNTSNSKKIQYIEEDDDDDDDVVAAFAFIDQYNKNDAQHIEVQTKSTDTARVDNTVSTNKKTFVKEGSDTTGSAIEKPFKGIAIETKNASPYGATLNVKATDDDQIIMEISKAIVEEEENDNIQVVHEDATVGDTNQQPDVAASSPSISLQGSIDDNNNNNIDTATIVEEDHQDEVLVMSDDSSSSDLLKEAIIEQRSQDDRSNQHDVVDISSNKSSTLLVSDVKESDTSSNALSESNIQQTTAVDDSYNSSATTNVKVVVESSDQNEESNSSHAFQSECNDSNNDNFSNVCESTILLSPHIDTSEKEQGVEDESQHSRIVTNSLRGKEDSPNRMVLLDDDSEQINSGIHMDKTVGQHTKTKIMDIPTSFQQSKDDSLLSSQSQRLDSLNESFNDHGVMDDTCDSDDRSDNDDDDLDELTKEIGLDLIQKKKLELSRLMGTDLDSPRTSKDELSDSNLVPLQKTESIPIGESFNENGVMDDTCDSDDRSDNDGDDLDELTKEIGLDLIQKKKLELSRLMGKDLDSARTSKDELSDSNLVPLQKTESIPMAKTSDRSQGRRFIRDDSEKIGRSPWRVEKKSSNYKVNKQHDSFHDGLIDDESLYANDDKLESSYSSLYTRNSPVVARSPVVRSPWKNKEDADSIGRHAFGDVSHGSMNHDSYTSLGKEQNKYIEPVAEDEAVEDDLLVAEENMKYIRPKYESYPIDASMNTEYSDNSRESEGTSHKDEGDSVTKYENPGFKLKRSLRTDDSIEIQNDDRQTDGDTRSSERLNTSIGNDCHIAKSKTSERSNSGLDMMSRDQWQASVSEFKNRYNNDLDDQMDDNVEICSSGNHNDDDDSGSCLSMLNPIMTNAGSERNAGTLLHDSDSKQRPANEEADEEQYPMDEISSSHTDMHSAFGGLTDTKQMDVPASSWKLKQMEVVSSIRKSMNQNDEYDDDADYDSDGSACVVLQGSAFRSTRSHDRFDESQSTVNDNQDSDDVEQHLRSPWRVNFNRNASYDANGDLNDSERTNLSVRGSVRKSRFGRIVAQDSVSEVNNRQQQSRVIRHSKSEGFARLEPLYKDDDLEIEDDDDPLQAIKALE